jgi:hypothetical protein
VSRPLFTLVECNVLMLRGVARESYEGTVCGPPMLLLFMIADADFSF